jgi:hypothetical protein
MTVTAATIEAAPNVRSASDTGTLELQLFLQR